MNFLAAASVNFDRVSIVGHSNRSHFAFPAIGFALGGAGAALSVCRSGDSGHCVSGIAGVCQQVFQTRDGGETFQLERTVPAGGTGNFNGYGNLGQLVPPLGANGTFRTLVGNNGGSWLGTRMVLSHWRHGERLEIVRNETTRGLRGTPAVFLHLGQSGRIARLGDGTLLAPFYGQASDAPTICAPPGEPGWARCSTLALYRSTDDGRTFEYASRLDHTANMPAAVEGPCEPSIAVLADGRVLLVFRLQSATELWQAYSSDGGRTWSEPARSAAWAVWPQLLLLSNGVLALSSGRPGIGLWLSHAGDGEAWEYHNIAAEHNGALSRQKMPAALAFAAEVASVTNASSPAVFAQGRQTAAYTSLVELEPALGPGGGESTALLFYDRLRVGCPTSETEAWCQAHGLGYDGGEDFVFAMRLRVSRPARARSNGA